MNAGLRRSSLTYAFAAALVLLPSAMLAAPPPAHRELPKPTNLQVLPKDISSKDLMATMRQFTGALGVHCNFCHEQNAQTHRPDFASDAKPEKAAARVMMRMTAEINAKYLTQLPDKGGMMQVSCGTCHRGHSTPEEFIPSPEKEGSHKK
ncbi:MAG TPA: c-type cytochrome [Edaphobacter sp.]|nr:c-type cytochrome [Edaphobacter sp.]